MSAFDVPAYTRGAHDSLRAAIHPAEYTDAVRDAAALGYLARRIDDVTGWLRNVLVTPTHKEARITAFLSTWAWERHWAADALQVMSDALSTGAPSIGETRTTSQLDERFGPLVEAVLAIGYGRRLTALHVTERLIDGWVLAAMLDAVARRTGDPALSADLAVVSASLERQQRFFAEETADWLALEPRARGLVRRRLARRAWPIGAEHEPVTTAAITSALFADDPEWAHRLDQQVDGLRGLEGLHLIAGGTPNPGGSGLRISRRVARVLGRTAASVFVSRKGHAA